MRRLLPVMVAVVLIGAGCGGEHPPEPTSSGPVHRCVSFAPGRHIHLALQNPPRKAVVEARVGTVLDVRISFEGGHFIVPGTPRILCQISTDRQDSVLNVHYRAVSAGVARLTTYNVPVGHIANYPLVGTVRILR